FAASMHDTRQALINLVASNVVRKVNRHTYEHWWADRIKASRANRPVTIERVSNSFGGPEIWGEVRK
ncbi:MAG: hypothetical protein MUD11_16990, partial [Rhodobacteraceae bacterium]|nr:hypothetical protein [Paracoccaceae bacterium]